MPEQASAPATLPTPFEEPATAARPAVESAEIRQGLAQSIATLPAPLAALWNRVAALESIQIKADVEILQTEAIGPQGRRITGLGTYEYWEQGGRYRGKVALPEALEMSPVTDWAFDGSLHQMFMADSKMLSVGRQDVRLLPLALKNPFFLLLGFLGPVGGEQCGRCELRLADIRAAGRAGVQGQGANAGSYRFGETEIRRVTMAANRKEIAAIETRARGGRFLSRAVFSDYKVVPGQSGWRLPRTIRLELGSEDAATQAPVLVAVYRIGLLGVDAPVSASAFEISWDRAERVWDNDRETFVGGREPREHEHRPRD